MKNMAKPPSDLSSEVTDTLRRRNFLRGLAYAAGGGALALLAARRAKAYDEDCPQKFSCDKPVSCSSPFTCDDNAFTCKPDYKKAAEDAA
ncbi:MAG: hypothetical protein LAP87_19265 [Acidobacteriia bacterium]|nr:hypothetical protein [Terriglobia bacterium]